MAYPNARSVVTSEFLTPSTMIMMQAPVAKRPSCCLIFIAVFLVLVSASKLGGVGYIAPHSTKLTYHYAFLVSGGLSFLTSIITLHAGQDIGRRKGWMIAASAFGIAGIISCLIAIPFGLRAIENKNTDCLLPHCKIKSDVEFSLNNFSFGGISCAWQCFDNYKTIWEIMIGLAAACAIFQAILICAILCLCLVDCCCR